MLAQVPPAAVAAKAAKATVIWMGRRYTTNREPQPKKQRKQKPTTSTPQNNAQGVPTEVVIASTVAALVAPAPRPRQRKPKKAASTPQDGTQGVPTEVAIASTAAATGRITRYGRQVHLTAKAADRAS